MHITFRQDMLNITMQKIEEIIMSQNITNRLPRLTASDIEQYVSSSHIIHKASTSKNNGTYDDTDKMY